MVPAEYLSEEPDNKLELGVLLGKDGGQPRFDILDEGNSALV